MKKIDWEIKEYNKLRHIHFLLELIGKLLGNNSLIKINESPIYTIVKICLRYKKL
jgi:hypothetical protein